MGFLETAASITPELSAYVAAVAEQDFSFVGEHPIEHSRANHVHLWKIEWLADQYHRIDLGIRCQAVEYIFERWRVRLKSYRPYLQGGYRLLLYEDSAPTVSVVAETPHGFPYGGRSRFVNDISTLLKPYERRSWKARFGQEAFFQPRDEKDIVAAVKHARGSLGTRAAQRVGLNVAELRKQIEWLEIGDEINALRKQFHRKPARLMRLEELPYHYAVFQILLPSRY
jgi:hypothetical protein